MICEVCGRDQFHDERVTRTFQVNGNVVLVEDIPAKVCSHCGEANFEAEVADKIRRLVHEPHSPHRVIQTEVLRYDAA